MNFQPVNPLPGELHLSPRTRRSRVLIERLLRNQEVQSIGSSGSGTITAGIREREFSPLLSALSAALTDAELESCTALFVPEGEVLGVDHLLQARSLRALTTEVQGHWLWELLKNDRITCHFQPIVTTSDPIAIVGYECLMRATDMRGRMVYPDRLLRAARDAGILPILDMAAQLTAIHEATRHEIAEPIFINVSPATIIDPLYDPRSVIAAARRSGKPASHFVFEVTESEQVTDVAELLRLSTRFRRIGVRVALDDLGAGYASLNMLPKLRPDLVKFDMQLIRDLHSDEFKRVVVTKLIEMTEALGIATIAEGIETQEEWEWVRRAGIGFGQGYLFARPDAVPPRLEAAEPGDIPEPTVHRLLDLYLESARARLLQMTEHLVASPEDGPIIAREALAALEDSLDIIDIVRSDRPPPAFPNGVQEVMTLTADGAVLAPSEQTASDLGYAPRELIGRDIFSLVHPDDLAEVVRAFESSLAEPQVMISCRPQLRRKNGAWVSRDLRGQVEMSEGGVAGYSIWIGEYATAMKGITN